MKRSSWPNPKDFRIRLETADGSLIQNRLGSSYFWLDGMKQLDKSFAEISLQADCREKGVSLVSYTWNKDGVLGIVKYL